MKLHINLQNTIDKFFRDKSGRYVIWQFPNLPIIGWFVFMVIAHLLSRVYLKSSAEFISSAFIFIWAYLEIAHGVNYFRRLLGLVVLLVTIVSHFYR